MRHQMIVILFAITLVIGWPSRPAAAHPIDSINTDQYSRLEIGRSVIRLRYIVEMGDIPAFSERRAIDANNDAQMSPAEQERYFDKRIPELLAGLSLTAGGTPLELRLVHKEISFPKIIVEDVEGGLITLRIALDLEADLGEIAQLAAFAYHNDNFADRAGWREIVVRPLDGITLSDSTAPEQDQSDELRAYPTNIQSLLDLRAASFMAIPAGANRPAAPPTASLAPLQRARPVDGFARLIAVPALTPQVLLFSLLLAFILGAGHALAPGHGKTIVAAYLVGNRGTARHAICLGVITTATHTIGVFALGTIILLISSSVVPEHLYFWLEFLSGALVIAIGFTMFRRRLAELLRRPTTDDRRPTAVHTHEHDHHHHHDHNHGSHDHSHMPPGADGQPVTWRNLLALGVSGGLLPCPSALVVLLGAIALNRVAFGMLLIVAFSFGLAGVLTGIGLLLIYARRLFERFPIEGRLLRVLPVASAAIVTLAGLGITAGALVQAGLLRI